MSFNKSRRLAVPFGISLLALAATVHAANAATPSFEAAIAPAPAPTTTTVPKVATHVAHSAAAPAPASVAPVTASTHPAVAPAQAPAVTAASAPVTGASDASPVAAASGESHLTLHDIDELARSRLRRALGGDGDTQAASGTAVTLKTPVPAATAPAPMAMPAVPAFVPRERTTPVTFVGAYSDASGQHILYQYNGAVYPARVGQPLLNGWVARRVEGLSVTVSQGKHTWSVPMSGGATESPASPFPGVAALGDLSSPLPAGVSLAQPISNFGRQ
ncbi:MULTISPECIES: hypothetical protein [unclassified Paraburkholderia]|uniref:hypothetical protein n=1 Tax=unclassified Paraburkholderia TaxID=2615204 RepID=UPI002AB14097|nr:MULTISPECIES: hypothetical protein [unclassified Paraburkholderia]